MKYTLAQNYKRKFKLTQVLYKKNRKSSYIYNVKSFKQFQVELSRTKES